MVTIEEVARHCNLSAMTVSRVINNKGYVSEETRRKVNAAVEELGYRPNLIARSLATSKTCTIGAFIPYLGNQLYSLMASGLTQEAGKHGYDIILSSSAEPSSPVKSIMSLINKQIDALVIFPMESRREAVLTTSGFRKDMEAVGNFYKDLETITEQLERQSVPGVIVGNLKVAGNFSYVREDYKGGAEMAVDYLVSRGHRKIGYLAHEILDEGIWGERYRGFIDAMEQNNCPVADDQIVTCLESVESGFDAMQRLLMRNTDITAVCCTNDMVATGALNAAHSMGCRIPEDLSVIGHDGSVYSEAVYPRLTTVSIRPVEIGKRAFAQALRLLEDPKAWDVDIVEPELLERDSVAMPSK